MSDLLLILIFGILGYVVLLVINPSLVEKKNVLAALMFIINGVRNVLSWLKTERTQATPRKYDSYWESMEKFVVADGGRSKEKGDAFEKFIVKKFQSNSFKIHEWRGDKYVEGLFADSNRNPDLEIEFVERGYSKRFAVECKFRQRTYNGSVDVGNESKLRRYKEYQEKKRLDVYIALGIGGFPDKPHELFLIPLSEVSNSVLHYNGLRKFKRSVDSDFVFSIKNGVLQ